MSAITLAADLVRDFEGFRAAPYLCPAGVWTIGYGTTHLEDDTPVTRYTAPVSRDEAEALMRHDLRKIETSVRALVTVPVSDEQTAALLDFAYNLGLRNLASSTLLRRLNRGDFAGAAAQFPLWVHAWSHGEWVTLPGLVKRRAAERALFETRAASA